MEGWRFLRSVTGAAALALAAEPLLADERFPLGDTPSAREPGYTVSFSGQLRVIGVAWDNVQDFSNTRPSGTGGSAFKDSQARYFERLRWWLTLESADKKAKIVWSADVGDLTWGNGGGVSDQLGSVPASAGGRVGPTGGGAEGARGVNMQQRQLYLAFEPWIENVSVTLGIQFLQFLESPVTEFFEDHAGAIRVDWRAAPIDVSLWTAKLSENDPVSADDNDYYAARVGFQATKDVRLTLEGLVGNWQCFQRRPLAPGAKPADTSLVNKGTCVSAPVADPFWVGSTANAKVGDLTLYGVVVYGERPLYSDARNVTLHERGWGGMVMAFGPPFGPLEPLQFIRRFQGWYTTGDKNRFVGSVPSAHGGPGAGQAFSTVTNPTTLNQNSHKLPVPGGLASSWLTLPYIAEALAAHTTLGGPPLGQPLYADLSGTWGVGASVGYALTSAFNVNAGLALVGSSETKNALGGKNAVFGDHVVEIDAGPRWTLNTNLSMQGVASYLIPQTGDNAWAFAFRTVFQF